ncbi:polypeptide N-acetylgalactosaminyltransferase 5-like [Pecten maximus]|uniref:polypeptide N-acetylgalactosaminyltransferase 5-like n=1 Tax=Pecten maximus TaxID=6579 RepID=UPI001459016E|nr:polypeptide N-acetylgalactosaminyltransferase 5-like [Pecten maximus]
MFIFRLKFVMTALLISALVEIVYLVIKFNILMSEQETGFARANENVEELQKEKEKLLKEQEKFIEEQKQQLLNLQKQQQQQQDELKQQKEEYDRKIKEEQEKQRKQDDEKGLGGLPNKLVQHAGVQDMIPDIQNMMPNMNDLIGDMAKDVNLKGIFNNQDGNDHVIHKRDLMSGMGEGGRAVHIDKSSLSFGERSAYDKGWKDNAFNEYLSDKISLHRSLPDPRDHMCKVLEYADNLPEASVIITFHNEAWSVLLRSVHSILDRSPEHLIKEIILADDFSDREHLHGRLEEYMKDLPKVKIVRNKQREGLIRTRLLGYSVATGTVLIFLDSHIECAPGWLEPLLDRIKDNPTTTVTPCIDTIDDDTFQFKYSPADATQVGGFDWSLTFTWHSIPERERERRNNKAYVPVRSPTMAGGLFAINKEFFTHIGTYDAGMDIWGGENLEISFRIWMCGGTLETIPCSHVGHIFRKKSPYTWPGNTNILKKNNVRMAEVWLDDFKMYYYDRIGNDLGYYGDISERKQLRESLQCHDFKWFLQNVYPELFIPGDSTASGQIKNVEKPICIDGQASYGSSPNRIIPYQCHGMGGNQYWMMSKQNEILRDSGCFDFNDEGLLVYSCHGQGGPQSWLYRDDNTLYNPGRDRCITLSYDSTHITMETCTGGKNQQWLWNRNPPKGPTRY